MKNLLFVCSAIVVGLGALSSVQASSKADAPMSLEQCYLKVAMQKSNAEMAYVAKTLCDAVFKEAKRSLVVLDSKSGQCTEWWLDSRGRYDSAAKYCDFQPLPKTEGHWILACEYKDRPARFGMSEVVATETGYTRHGKAVGQDIGRLFKSLAACLRHKSRT